MEHANKQAKNYIKLLTVVLLLFSCSTKNTTRNFPDWMLGEWHHTGYKFNIIEKWTSNEKTSMYVGKTIWHYPGQISKEEMKLYIKNDTLFYLVKTKNKTTIFSAKDFKGDTIRFYNAKNQFPKYLIYSKQGTSKMKCWIENFPKDPNKQEYFFYKKS